MEVKNKCIVKNQCFGFVLLESDSPKETEEKLSFFFLNMCFVSRCFCSRYFYLLLCFAYRPFFRTKGRVRL